MSASSARQYDATAREIADHITIENLWRDVTDGSVHPRMALRMLVTQTMQLTAADGCAIALADRSETGRIKCQASSGSAPPVGVDLDASTGLSGECIRTGTSVVCLDTAADLRVDPETCQALNLKSALIVPVKDEHTVVGVVEVFASRIHGFDAEDVRVVEQIAQIVAAIWTCLDYASTQPSGNCEVVGRASPIKPPHPQLVPDPPPAPAANVAIEDVVLHLRSEALTAPVDDEVPEDDDKRQATRVALFFLAIVGTMVLALVIYAAMRGAFPSFSGSAASKTAATTTAAAEAPLPESDATTRNGVGTKRSGTARKARDARSPAASPRSGEAASSDPADQLTTAVALAPPAPVSSGSESEEVSPPALNINESAVKISEALPPPAIPRLNSHGPVETSKSAASSTHAEPSRLLHKTIPTYPPAAFSAGISGTVVLQAKIAPDGHVRHIDVLRGSALFISAAVNAVRSWKYRPAHLDGTPVESVTVITINFSR